MNKRFLGIVVLIALTVILVSSGVAKLILKRSANLVDDTDLKNKESLLELADSYRAKGDYAKAKDALEEFVEGFPDSRSAAKIQKDIEGLNIKILFSNIPTDDSFQYEIKPGDSLTKIAYRYNTTVELLKESNLLETDLILPGKFLKVNKAKFTLFVDKAENTLTLRKTTGETVKTYVVSTGKDFSTPTGTFKIEEKLISPPWYKVGAGAVVQPESPDYELGSRWMGISEPDYGIHGTADVSSIGQYITNGCVRMRNEDVEELYAIVPSGTTVEIVE